MADQKRLAYSIIQFLHDQLQNGGLSPDAQESLEGRRLWALPCSRVHVCQPKTWGDLHAVTLSCLYLGWALPNIKPCSRFEMNLSFWGSIQSIRDADCLSDFLLTLSKAD